MSFLVPFLLTVHIIVCLLLVLVVLMQLPRSEGLGAAFGGAVTDNIFGAQTTHVLAKFTVWLGVAFFVITLLLAMAYTHRTVGKTAVSESLLNAPVPTATAAPLASPDASVAPETSTPALETSTPAPAIEPAMESAAPAPTPVAAPAQ